MFDVPRTHFELMWHRAGLSGLAQDAQGSLLDRFREEQELEASTGAAKKDSVMTASWVEDVAQHCHGHDKRPHEFKLSVAAAQRPYRNGVYDEVSDYDEHTAVSDLPFTTTPFLACARHAPTSTSGATFWNRVMVPFAVGLSPRLPTWYDAGDEVHAPELVKVVLDLVEHVLAQPSRLFAPGLAINETVAYLVVLDHETCRIATILDCWQRGFGELAAVLSVLLDLDVYSAGFPSFLRYKCLPSSGITAVSLLASVFDSSAGRSVQLEEEEPIALLSGPAGKRGSVFSRSTAVFHLTRPSLQRESGDSVAPLGSSFVFKMSFVSPSTANVELDMLTQITKALDDGTLLPKVAQHLALPELAQSLSPHKSQVEDARLPRPPAPPQDMFLLFWPPRSEVSRRTLELLVLRNPTPLPVPLVDFARPLEPKPLPLPQILQVFDQLLTVLAILAERNFHHRDLSVGHILHYQGHLVLVDWSAGIRAPLSDSVLVGAEESSGYLKGSPESAPLNWLESNNGVGACPPIPYQPAHALESTIYCLLVVLAHRIAAQEEIWRTLRLQRQREKRESPIYYFYLRCMVWEHGPSPFQRHLVRRGQLLAAIRGEDAALGDLVDAVTEEWPLWPFMRSIDNGGKALWAAIHLKFHAFGGNAQ